MNEDIHSTTTFFNRKQLGLKLLTIWAGVLTGIAIYNFKHNLEDMDRYAEYEKSIAEHVEFRKNDAYLRGAVDALKPCATPANQNDNQDR